MIALLYLTHTNQHRATIIEDDKFNIAILSLEKLNSNFGSFLRNFVQSKEEISIITANVRDRKEITSIYKRIKKNLVIPREGLENFYTTKFAKHFLSPQFRREMIDKWSRPR